MTEFFHSVATLREPDRAGLMVVDWIIFIFGKLCVQLGAVVLHLDDIAAAGECRDITCCMPGGTGG